MRASDQRREATVAALRDRALDGCLTLDTFADRVDAAYRAKTEEELEYLVDDMPRERGRLRALAESLGRGIAWLMQAPVKRLPALEIEVRLPHSREALTVGRSSECDVVVSEATVSRVHAELRHGDGDTWTVRDLGSMNGTWLNGLRVREAPVCGGDELFLGGLRMELRL